MRSYHIYNTWMVFFSFIIAILLQFIFPFLTKFYFKPSVAMILLIYWVMSFPKRINIGASFILGLIMDCIFSSVFGIYALSFSVMSYLTVRKIHFFRHASILQQSFFVFFLSLIDQSFKLLINFLIIETVCVLEIFWISIHNGIMWPCLIFLMHRIYKFE